MGYILQFSFVVFFISMGIYYFQFFLLILFPTEEAEKDTTYTDDIDLTFFIVIPCLNEEDIIVETVGHLLNLKMKQTHIIVTDDASTDSTVQLLEDNFKEEISSRELILLKKKLPNAQKGKGHSLNYSYEYIGEWIRREKLDPHACIMSVFDADVFFKRELMERVAVIMDRQKETELVQARVRIGTITRDYFLPRFQDIEFFTIINLIQNFREYIGTVAAAGNGQFTRFSSIDPENPWTDCLLEDFDFSTRILLKGGCTHLVQSQAVYQQGVKTYRAFLKQRSRWCQGGLQCYKYVKKAWTSKHFSILGKVEISMFLAIPYIVMISTLNLIFSFFTMFFLRSTSIEELVTAIPTWELWMVVIFTYVLVFSPGLFFLLKYHSETKEDILSCILCGLFWPIYSLSQVPAVIMAFYRQLKGKTEWIKTHHENSR